MSPSISLPLGFGCSTLTDHPSPRDALRCLEDAFALGIKHFDVARGYGRGEAEGILGQFAKSRRAELYLVTKFGLNPAARGAYARSSHAVARSLGSAAYQTLRQWARNHLRKPYGPRNMRQSLETSLRALGTDYVDCLLLHEASVADANNDSLIAELERLSQQGKIRSFGIGSQFDKLSPALATLSPKFTVLQYDHSPLSPAGLRRDIERHRTVFTHSALKALSSIGRRAAQEQPLVEAFARSSGVDPRRAAVAGGLLLAYSHAQNPSGRVIFSTTSTDHLKGNVAVFTEYLAWDDGRKSSVPTFFDALLTSGRAAHSVQ